MKINNSSEFVSVNGKQYRSPEAKIPAVSSGLFYGAGCFETMRYESSGIFRLHEHVERLNGGWHIWKCRNHSFSREKLYLKRSPNWFKKMA